MWAPPEGMMSFSNNPAVPQHNSAQFSFNNRGNMPPPMQRSYPPTNMMPTNQQHKMGNGPPMMFPPQSIPMDMMGINLPPPHPNSSAPHPGAVGSQRNDRQPFQSLMAGSFGGPPHQPPHQFSQPPPSMDMRFAQHPPPPFAHGNHDMSWNPASNKPYGSPQQHMGANFRSNF